MAVTTASLAANAIENDTLVMAKGVRVWKVVVSSAARVRLYATSALRTTDTSPDRPNTIPPTPGTQHGVILDLFLDTSDKFTWYCAPVADGANGDTSQSTNIYAAITNIGTGTVAITVTIHYIPQES